jgi:F-type H+-transporting ATPase subunit b
LPAVLLASGVAEGEGKTDIVPRVINFVIFASILYYLIAKPLKDYFTGRTTEIADRLTSIQDKLKESKDEKEQALQSVKDADESAIDLIETAKKEAEILSDKVAQNLKKDLENLQKSHDDRIAVEEKKMSRSVVAEVIEEMFDSGKINLKNDDFLNIIKKKVA